MGPGLSAWDNVRLVAAPADRAPIDGTADAALFHAVNDVMQSRAALEHVFDQLRPEAPVAAVGGKWPSAWLWSVRACQADLNVPLSPTSATSTDHGLCWPSSRPTRGCTSWRSVPDT